VLPCANAILIMFLCLHYVYLRVDLSSCICAEIITIVDWFVVLRFMVTSAPLAVNQIRILLMKSACLMTDNVSN
jgi:hypothetical protein